MRLVTLTLGWLVLVACTPTLGLEVQLTLTPAYMASLTYPVQLAFTTDLHRGASQSLCGAYEQTYFVTLRDETEACAEPVEVRVAVGPFDPPATGCVEERANTYAQALELGGSHVASETAFAEADPLRCDGGSEIVRITLGDE